MPYRVVPRQRYTVILLFVSFFCQTGWLLRRETWAPSEQTAANLSHLRWDKSTIEKVSVCWQILKQLGAMPCKYVQWEGSFKGWRPEPAQSLQEIYPLVIAYRNLVENSVYLFCYLPLHLYHSIIYYSIWWLMIYSMYYLLYSNKFNIVSLISTSKLPSISGIHHSATSNTANSHSSD